MRQEHKANRWCCALQQIIGIVRVIGIIGIAIKLEHKKRPVAGEQLFKGRQQLEHSLPLWRIVELRWY